MWNSYNKGKKITRLIKGRLFAIIVRNLSAEIYNYRLHAEFYNWKPNDITHKYFPLQSRKKKKERESCMLLWIDFWINALSLPHLSRNVKLFISLSGDTQFPCESLSVVMKWWHWVWNQLLLQHQCVSCKHYTRGTEKALK